jgi:hypothetical protein
MSVEHYSQPLPVDQVAARTDAQPGGLPAPTGYYPNDRGHLQHPYPAYPQYPMDDRDIESWQYVVQDYLHDAELIDQHPYLQVTATWTPRPNDQRFDGVHDPLTDGPPQPYLDDLARWYYRGPGSSVTGYADVPGRTFPPIGSQDGQSWIYAQSPQLTLAPYAPAEPGGEMPDTLRSFAPSPAHGWASRPLLSSSQEVNAKANALTQQQQPHQDYLATSTYAGQSYSARTASVGPATASVPSMRRRG